MAVRKGYRVNNKPEMRKVTILFPESLLEQIDEYIYTKKKEGVRINMSNIARSSIRLFMELSNGEQEDALEE